MMTSALWWLLQNTITIGVLVAIVALLSRRLRTRPALEHALWLIVLVKFVTPPIVIWPWPVRSVAVFVDSWHSADWADQEQTAIASKDTARRPPNHDRTWPPQPAPEGPFQILGAQTPTADQANWNRDMSVLDAGDAELAGRLAEFAETQTRHSTAQVAPGDLQLQTGYAAADLDHSVPEGRDLLGDLESTSARSIAECWFFDGLPMFVIGLWLAGGMATAITQWRRLANQSRLVSQAIEAPPHLVAEIRQVAQAMHTGPIVALIAAGIESPLVWCLGRIRLLWPKCLAGPAEVVRYRGVIAHELAHVRRRDHWVAWLELAAGVIWWWNPLFWLVRGRLRETAEIACDAIAMSVLTKGRRQYAEAFLQLSMIGKAWAPAPVLGMSIGARRTFERRFAMMLSENVRSKMSQSGLVAVSLLALIALPSWSLGQGPSPDGTGSASVSSDSTIGPATQSAAPKEPSAFEKDPIESEQSASDSADESKTVAKRLEQLNAAGAALDAEQKERAARDQAAIDMHQLAVELQQAHKDLALMRTGGPIDAEKLARAQQKLAQLRQRMNDQKQPSSNLVTEMYLNVLGRRPSDTELSASLKQLDANLNRDKIYDDLYWTLLNSKEFARGATNRTATESSTPPADPANQGPTGGGASSRRSIPRAQESQPENLETRVRRLEDKLDTILEELRTQKEATNARQSLPTGRRESRDNVARFGTRATPRDDAEKAVSPEGTASPTPPNLSDRAPSDANRSIVFKLQYARALNVQNTLSELLEPRQGRIVADDRTNSIFVNGPEELIRSVRELIENLDIPSDGEAVPPASRDENPAASPVPRKWPVQPSGPAGGSAGSGAAQLDVVNLGTAIIDARGALRLAQAQYERMKKLSSSATIPQEELDVAAINLDTAREKVELLTRIARSSFDSANGELLSARAVAEHARKMYEKGFMTQAQAAHAEAQISGAEAKLRIFDSILNAPRPSSP
jgi:beta-lactamase regulating signal transducer with metallopeptidase domain